MAQLTSVTSAGSGMVGVILPDVTTSARYTSYDLPYLTKAFQMAGYTSAQFKIDNASGTTTTEVALAPPAQGALDLARHAPDQVVGII